MPFRVAGFALATAAFLSCGVAALQAATITAFGTTLSSGVSSSVIGPVGSTPSPNNDNAPTPSPNTVPYTVFFNALGGLDVEFVLTDSGGTTEYRFTQTFFNVTAEAWSGFSFELGFGTGTGFTRSSVADDLDFDTPDQDPAPFSSRFAALDHQADSMTWAGGTVPPITVAVFGFAIDVPDNLQSFHPSGQNRFTLRQTLLAEPAPIPEPSTMMLLGTGLAGLCLKLRRR